MHYTTAERKEHLKHGLRHDPFKALVAPRPIGWITTIGPDGQLNLAPYSFFNAVSDYPLMVMFSSNSRKDSVSHAEASGEFTCSMATQPQAERMNLTSAAVASDVSEYSLAGLTTAPSLVVKPPRVEGSPAALECRTWKVIELPRGRAETTHYVTFGEVVAIYIDDRFVHDGLVDTAAMRPVARMGYMDYAVVTPDTRFTMVRPQVDADRRTATVPPAVWDGVYR
jgi:flavin reductase (DIM6/NTAB) family NADH-FMN oxidoreductase RutF